MKIWFERILHVGLGMFLVAPSLGYSVNFAQRPLSVGNAVEPNVMLLLDDSGSMEWDFIPDELMNKGGGAPTNDETDRLVSQNSGEDFNRWFYSSHVNKIYFDPDKTYTPPRLAAPSESGSTDYPDSLYTDASIDGYANGTKYDLSNRYEISDYGYDGGWVGGPKVFDNAFYYQYDSNNTGCTDERNNNCYTYVSANTMTDAEKKNFANWYSYYRTRMFSTRVGISEAFDQLENNFRLGWGRINKGASDVDGANVRSVVNGVRQYTTSHKQSFYNFIYSRNGSGSTPLRSALEGAGNYYEDSAQSWTANPDGPVSSSNPELECRLAYTLLMTDGTWNQGAPSSAIGNADNPADGSIITQGTKSYKYEAQDPFKDGHSNTLADVAMHFWKRDLRPDLDNYVPQKVVRSVPTDISNDETPFKSPAFWQHMVTYGIGLGVEPSEVDPEAAFRAIRDGTNIAWPRPSNLSPANIDDLLHAGVNSYGGFFSAADSQTFASELSTVLAEITADPGSATSAEVAGETVAEGELLFAASYDPSDWAGDLKAATFGAGANLIPDFDAITGPDDGWSAAEKLDAASFDPDTRMVMTYVDGDGAPFRWADLGNNTTQTADLNYGGDATATLGGARLAYIRGNQSREGAATAPSFRPRTSLLGSIINSSPNYVGAPSSAWPDSGDFGVDGKRYSTFAADKASRNPVVYVGSNDGMLHGFQATLGAGGGDEVFAYIPGFLYSYQAGRGLHHLTDPTYTHRYYVDLATRKADVYTKGRSANDGSATAGKDWRTILVGGARAGGKGIFALDVTDPDQFSEANAPGLALWEFTATDDDRLGYITQPPVIALAEWGGQTRWSVFLANGYDSTTATTGFFVLDIEAGLDGLWDENSGDYKYVELESVGDGLSPVTVLDTTGDYLADRVYAGDLDGQIWVASNSSGSWAKEYANALFTANGPVTGAVAVSANKATAQAGNEPNLMVYFGTGKYLETTDTADTSAQAFYGVWDKGIDSILPSRLVHRTLTAEERDVDEETKNIRVSTGDPVDYTSGFGWWAELPDTGERVVNNPIVRGDYVYINTIVPSVDPCSGGGSGWIMSFGLKNGLAVDHTKAFTTFPDDTLGYQTGGIPSQLIIRDNTLIYDVSGDDPVADELPPLGSEVPGAGRRGWHELLD